MNRPFVIALLAGLAVLLLAAALPLWHLVAGAPPAAPTGQPWQVLRQGDRIGVFGLQLPGSTLADARARWGDGLELAVMATRGQPGALEAYVDRYEGGGVEGRLVLATALPADRVAQLQQQAAKNEPVDADTRRFFLRSEDRAALADTSISGISFVVSARLDAATLRQRFGAPAERWQAADGVEHWLYPALGLAIARGRGDAASKAVLQYVAPADFEARLRAPLQAAGAVPSA